MRKIEKFDSFNVILFMIYKKPIMHINVVDRQH